MSSSAESLVKLAKGDVLRSQAQTIVNTVNCVGVMGKGVALAFRHQYPEMYRDYIARCDKREVEVGKPYPYKVDDHIIVNFPTKKHWRSVSRLSGAQSPTTPSYKVHNFSIALVAILANLEESIYHWPVGRVMLQKIAYFATVGGLPTECEFEAASYGPFAPGLKRELARLQDNGLVREEQRGKMLEVTVGPTFAAASAQAQDFLVEWRNVIERVSDLVARFDTRQAEVAATVHYTASDLKTRLNRAPFASEVLTAVEQWKVRRKPPFTHDDINQAIVTLVAQGWIDIVSDASMEEFLDGLARW